MALLYIIIIVAFIDTFSQLPIIAPFAISLGATPMLVGIIIGLYSFSNIIGNIVSGYWIDRSGPKIVLCVGMIVVGIVLFFYSLVTTPQQLAYVRFFHGLAGGLIVPAAFTYLGSRKTSQSKGRIMAFSGASVGIAAIAGPALGAIISGRFGYDYLFFTLTVLMIGCAVLAIFFVKELQVISSKAASPQITSLKLTKPMLFSYTSIFLLMFTLGILTFALPLKVEELQLSAELTGPLLSVFGLVAILIFVLPTNVLFDKWNNVNLMTIGLVIICGALVSLSLSASFIHLLLAMMIYGVGFAFIFPSTSATVVEHSGEAKRGKAFGLFYACFSFGVITGSFFAGALAVSPSFLFFIGALCLLLIIILLYLFSWKPVI
jgi:MFS family permease